MKHYKRVKATYDRGYVNAMDKIRVFIESNQKVMYIGTGEYAHARKKDSHGYFPTVTVRQLMWALRMKPLKKERWETSFDHVPI